MDKFNLVEHNMEQGTPEWFEIRKKVLTASNATAIGNAGAGLKTYCKSLIQDLIHEPEPGYMSDDMVRGNELEPIARMKYAFEKGVEVSGDAVKRAVLDSVRAFMLIRAYRIRGHLNADLDPQPVS